MWGDATHFRRFATRAAVLCAAVFPPAVARAGTGPVVTDGTLGPAVSVAPLDGTYVVGAELGQRRGGNLFHSFTRLDVPTGDAVVFDGPPEVQNVLARVTGGAASNVDG